MTDQTDQTEKAVALEPCPFCGSDKLEIGAINTKKWAVVCGACDASVEAFGRRDTQARWNRRSGRAVVSEAGEAERAIGFMYAYACNCADKGIDIRTLELPAIYEEYQRATRSPT